MKRFYDFTVHAEDPVANAENFLTAHRIPQKLISHLRHHNDDLLINGVASKTTAPLHENDQIRLIIHEQPNEKIVSAALSIPIVYEDDWLVVVNKPADVASIPSIAHYTDTLANWYMDHTGRQTGYHCLTRLDRQTSGLALLAKDRLVAAMISPNMIQKQYLALAQGKTDLCGIIDRPIGRKGNSVLREVRADGHPALTHYHRIDYDSDLDISFIKLELKTGQTHQIRVHLLSIGHPLVGDMLYNPDNHQMNRQALHVGWMRFVHPISGQVCEFSCPLPEDMAELVR